MDDRTARLILNGLPNIGPITLRRLADAFGSPGAALGATRAQLLSIRGVGPEVVDTIRDREKLFDAPRELARIKERGMRFLIPDDPGFPPLLREIHDTPCGLYSLGGYDAGERCVAIVGTRKPTPYGKSLARDVAGELARAGWCVVSGLARGVDAEAHRGALDAGGTTAAVLGSGADIVYPAENHALYREIAERGVILSEFSLGRPPDKQTFPMRNRIVAGMCRAVVVIESDEGGGSLITAHFAAESGRTVCAFPGRVDQPTSRGCHALIRDGATLVTGAEDILEELGAAPGSQRELPLTDEPSEPVDESDAALLKRFSGGGRHTPDSLADITGLAVGDISAALLMLELSGRLVRLGDGAYEAVRRR